MITPKQAREAHLSATYKRHAKHDNILRAALQRVDGRIRATCDTGLPLGELVVSSDEYERGDEGGIVSTELVAEKLRASGWLVEARPRRIIIDLAASIQQEDE